ncbi:MAG: aminopeptidase [Lachnospiraceae bacterium]|nr:aminopeptidase [Lachnospiraceae bacterium]
MMEERYQLSIDRIKEVTVEEILQQPFLDYFRKVAGFLLEMDRLYVDITKGCLEKESMEELQKRNAALYEDIAAPSYEESYANPDYAVSRLGEPYGALLSFLYTEMRAMIGYAYEQEIFEYVIRMELFLEIYGAFCDAFQENSMAPDRERIRDIMYWYVSDYSEPEMEQRIGEQLDPSHCFAGDIIMESDLRDLRYLYRYGEYITENEIGTARHLNELSTEEIQKIADTYTEGYRMGFVNGNKDLSKKKVVNIRFCVGFERVIRQAILNFRKMGLQPTIYRAGYSIFHRRGVYKIGYYGACINKQYEYDHKEDLALFYDKLLMNRKLEILREAYEKEKEWADVHAGPACMEVFGEEIFQPVNKKTACRMSEEQQKLSVEYASRSGSIVNEYIRGDERSFTIIAFPIPEIGPDYEQIFDEVVRINTLDYQLYESIQQKIIEALNQACYVRILGGNGNRTDISVFLQELKNPDRETNFENCVADVNIPVGEVFTSPQLKHTDGTLHVSRVFLNELEYRDLEIHFRDGMITSYDCRNFATEEENKRYIKENVLFHHESLPIGEFAIGTNTTAYVVAAKYGIADKMPILIAEKMGPHFAVGDTCYSHSEDVAVYNPDGKEIVARDNEVSLLRKTDRSRAYFNCHTDITIPYDELELIQAVRRDGTVIPIIQGGRFVLPGCEALNIPFDSEKSMNS